MMMHNRNEDNSPSEGDSVQSSARVIQLKREIEDLNARLSHTNTMNFEELRASMIREGNTKH
jgi:hypothetical protein